MRIYALAFVLLFGITSLGLITASVPEAPSDTLPVSYLPAIGTDQEGPGAPAPVPVVNPELQAQTTPTPAVAVSPAPPPPSPTASPPPASAQVFVGAGDIANCTPGAAATAKLLDSITGTVFTLGDNAYPSGSATDFANCYEPTWGRHKARTRPAAGNHEYATPGASPYYAYFGTAAGEPGKGYYSYDLGAWHIVVLNSSCDYVGGCGPNSPQVKWLQADLAANASQCTLAIGHHPRFSSGSHGNSSFMQPIWQVLYDAGADAILAGHDHIYERFAPQDPAGRADPQRGIRQIIAGMGGASHYGFRTGAANSEVGNTDTYGVLKLTLRAADYDWEFVPEPGKTFTDSGTGACH